MAYKFAQPFRSHLKLAARGLLLPVPAIITGCASAAPADSKIDPEAWASPHAMIVTHASTISVAEGALPLVYETTQAGTVRVVEQESGRQVAVASADAGQIVAASAAKGVRVGGIAVSGPLPADRHYTIYVDINRSEAGPPVAEPQKK